MGMAASPLADATCLTLLFKNRASNLAFYGAAFALPFSK